jgi:hypothetical protein
LLVGWKGIGLASQAFIGENVANSLIEQQCCTPLKASMPFGPISVLGEMMLFQLQATLWATCSVSEASFEHVPDLMALAKFVSLMRSYDESHDLKE